MPYDSGMSTRDVIARELEWLPEQDPDKLLSFLRSLKEAHAENAARRSRLNPPLQRTG